MRRCVIIDYGSGNLRSAAKAFERAAIEAELPIAIEVARDADTVLHADRVVLPGVGAFADCRQGLDALPGMADALRRRVLGEGVPFLGICVGMQLMAERGREFVTTAGLGWIAGDVVPIAEAGTTEAQVRIPHMGWNDLELRAPGHPVFAGLPAGSHMYFVHSFKLACRDAGDVLAAVHYGGEIAAAVGRDNLVGTQFHPEKSQRVGLRFITNFLRWQP